MKLVLLRPDQVSGYRTHGDGGARAGASNSDYRITATESRNLRAIKLNLLDRDVPSRCKMEITPDMRLFQYLV